MITDKDASAESGSFRGAAVTGISPPDKQLSSEKMSQLLHELRVYQVELEIQNEELRQTKHDLEISQTQYIELYEYAPLAYISLDEHGLFERVNMTFVKMTGTDRETLLNRRFTSIILPEDQDIYYLKRRQPVADVVGQPWDMRMLRADGSIFWAQLLIVPLPYGACRLTLTDITERKINELIMTASLKLSEYAVGHSLDELLTKVVDEAEVITSSKIGFFHFVEPDQVTLQLQAWSTNTVKTVCTAEGKGQHYSIDKAGVWVESVKLRKPVIHNSYATLPDRKGLPPGHSPVEREMIVPIFRGDLIVAIVGVGNKPTDYTEFDVNGVSKLLNFTWDIVSNKLKEVALEQSNAELEMRVHERTLDLQQAYEQMKNVSFDLVWAEEKERERIAAELHDQVGQSLLLAKMKLDAVVDSDASEASRVMVEAASSLLEKTIHNIRSLTFRMRPPILDTAGIETTFQWLCASISQDYGLKIDFVNEGHSRQFSPEIRYSLYQAIRELLLNVAKHAKTETAELQVKSLGDSFEVKVIDKGVGFDNTVGLLKHMKNGGYGLYNVKQRIERLNGSLDIESNLDKGTVITVRIPLSG